MGAIQGAINSLVGTAGQAVALPKAIKSLQEQASALAMKKMQDELDMKLKQQQIKTSRSAQRLMNEKRKQIKGGKV